jgi:hypothetical protein
MEAQPRVTAQPSFFRLARRSFWLLFGGVWLFVGLMFLAFAVAFVLDEFEYAANGVTTTGMVLTKDIVAARSNSSTQYRVSYRFTTGRGEIVEGSDTVTVATWERLQERGPIEVHYLPARPSSNRLAPGTPVALPVVFLLVGLVVSAVGAVLSLRALRRIFEERRVLGYGRSTVATVTEIEETNITVNGRQQFKVRFSYRDEQGGVHVGDSGYLNWDEAARWALGDKVAIRYDRGRPEESVWLGEIQAKPGPTVRVDAPPPGPNNARES